MAASMNGIALHGGLLPFGATFFNFLDYCKPAVRLAAINKSPRDLRLHPRFRVPGRRRSDAPADRAARDAARDPERDRPASRRRAGNPRSLEVRDPARNGPVGAGLSRQKLPSSANAKPTWRAARTSLRDPEGGADLVLIASGSEVSLALDAAKLLAERGTRARVVSMPSWKLFDAQDAAYRESVIPPDIKARMSIEAGATLGWSKYVGDRGIAYGLDHFGTSAPGCGDRERVRLHPRTHRRRRRRPARERLRTSATHQKRTPMASTPTNCSCCWSRSEHLARQHPAQHVRVRRTAAPDRPRLARDDVEPDHLRESDRRGHRLRRAARHAGRRERPGRASSKRSRSATSAAPATSSAASTMRRKGSTATSRSRFRRRWHATRRERSMRRSGSGKRSTVPT